MPKRKSYLAKAEKEFAEVQAQLAGLAKDAKAVVNAAQSKHDEALHRFELLKLAGKDSFESVKSAFETAWADLRHALAAKG